MTNETLDVCAYHALDSNLAFDEMVLFSGRYFSGLDAWAWCPDDKCDTAFGYENWDGQST